MIKEILVYFLKCSDDQNPNTMKKTILLFLISISGLSSLLYGQESNRQKLVPCKNQSTFTEEKQEYIYQLKDSVYVSIAFKYHVDGESVFDLVIDNQSSDTLEFDPKDVYLFRYANNVLAEQKLYHPIDPKHILDSIDSHIEIRKDRIKTSTILSIALSVLCLSAEIAGAGGDMNYATLDAILLTHDAAQIGLDISRQHSQGKICDLNFKGDYWSKGVIQKCLVLPDSFEGGHIHFRVPESEVFKIYVPFEYRIFKFTFQAVRKNEKAYEDHI